MLASARAASRVQSRVPSRVRWPVALTVMCAMLLVVCTGCSGRKNRLVGLHDVVLTFRLADPQAASPPREEIERRTTLRLASIDVSADLDVSHPGEVRVRVDQALANETESALLWQGGLALARLEPTELTHPFSGPGGAPRTEVERVIAEARPAQGTQQAPGRRFAREALGDAEHERLRIVDWPPAMPIDTTGVVLDGPRVAIPLAAETETKLRGLLEEGTRSGVPLVLLYDRTVLATTAEPLLHDHRLVLPLGSTIVAYTLAADLARVLGSPRLPRMSETSATTLSPDWLLAGANLLLPFAVSFAWLFFVRRFDRAQPEPMWLVVGTFALGALAILPAGLVEWGWDSLSPYTNPTLLTFGRSLWAFPIALAGFILTVGLTEEAMKLLATWALAIQRPEFDEPVDGMVYGAAAALGFAAAENIRYLAVGRVAGALVASRAFLTVPAHLFFGTIWGYALGRRLVEPHRPVWPLFLAAATLHALFDTCLSIDGAQLWAVPVALGVASIFIYQLRVSLRHGAIARTGSGSVPTVSRGPQELFRMGSNRVFAAFAGAMYLFAALVFLLTLVRPLGRADVLALGLSALALGLLGWAARGVAASLPLDVVIDDSGVTFAGAEVLYGDVVRIERHRVLGSPRRQEQMIVVGAARKLILGPANRETMDALAHALAMRLTGSSMPR